MKKTYKILLLIFIALLSLSIFSACTEGVQLKLYFDSNGGNEIAPLQISGLSSNINLQDPIKEGYTFDGWYWDNETFENPFTINSIQDVPLSEKMMLYAKWIPNDDEVDNNENNPDDNNNQGNSTDEETFSIHFDTNGGNQIEEKIIKKDEEIILPENPKKNGLIFLGWFDENLQREIDIDSINSDTTIYAKWIRDTYLTERNEYLSSLGVDTCILDEELYRILTGDYISNVSYVNNIEILFVEDAIMYFSYNDKNEYNFWKNALKFRNDDVYIFGNIIAVPIEDNFDYNIAKKLLFDNSLVQKRFVFEENYEIELDNKSTVFLARDPFNEILPDLSIIEGWYDNEDFDGNPISFPYFGKNNITDNNNVITLYAKWKNEEPPTNNNLSENLIKIIENFDPLINEINSVENELHFDISFVLQYEQNIFEVYAKGNLYASNRNQINQIQVIVFKDNEDSSCLEFNLLGNDIYLDQRFTKTAGKSKFTRLDALEINKKLSSFVEQISYVDINTNELIDVIRENSLLFNQINNSNIIDINEYEENFVIEINTKEIYYLLCQMFKSGLFHIDDITNYMIFWFDIISRIMFDTSFRYLEDIDSDFVFPEICITTSKFDIAANDIEINYVGDIDIYDNDNSNEDIREELNLYSYFKITNNERIEIDFIPGNSYVESVIKANLKLNLGIKDIYVDAEIYFDPNFDYNSESNNLMNCPTSYLTFRDFSSNAIIKKTVAVYDGRYIYFDLRSFYDVLGLTTIESTNFNTKYKIPFNINTKDNENRYVVDQYDDDYYINMENINPYEKVAKIYDWIYMISKEGKFETSMAELTDFFDGIIYYYWYDELSNINGNEEYIDNNEYENYYWDNSYGNEEYYNYNEILIDEETVIEFFNYSLAEMHSDFIPEYDYSYNEIEKMSSFVLYQLTGINTTVENLITADYNDDENLIFVIEGIENGIGSNYSIMYKDERILSLSIEFDIVPLENYQMPEIDKTQYRDIDNNFYSQLQDLFQAYMHKEIYDK